MRNILLLTTLSIILMAASCKPDPVDNPDPTTDVKLNFKVTYDGQPFIIGEEYEYDGMGIVFNRFNFYISEVVLTQGLDPNSDRTEVVDIEYVNATENNVNLAAAESGININIAEIPVGDYVGLRIGVGVPADMNRKSPQDFSDTHVLGTNGDYWTDWTSYIFSQTDGRLDNDPLQPFNLGFAYHTGTDPLYAEKTFLRNLLLEEDITEELNFTIDLKRLFFDEDGTKILDIVANPGTHNATQLEIAETITDNLVEAIKMQ